MKEKIFTVLAALMLIFPLALSPFHADMKNNGAHVEKCSFAENPAKFMENNLAGRTFLITLRGKLLSLLGESGNDSVIRGRHGFLFYGDTVPDYTGTRNLSKLHKAAENVILLEQKLREKGIELVVIIAPNKSHVYGEYMPVRYIKGRNSTALKKMQELLGAAGVKYVDAAAILTASKSEGQLYFSGDTHWNARGAWRVYEGLCAVMNVEPLSEPCYEPGSAGDLTKMCMPGQSTAEGDAVPVLERCYTFAKPMRTMDDMKIVTSTQGSRNVIVIRDSFGAMLFPYMANTFGKLTYSRIYDDIFSQAVTANADTAVLEIAERNLLNLADMICD